MMRFLRTNATLPFGNRNISRNLDPDVPTRPNATPRPIPTPLQFNDQSDARTTRGNRQPPSRLSKRMSDMAWKFPFYHGYLTEDQEEEVFKDHLFNTGSYIMRDSKSNSNAITMSVVIDPLHLYHFQVVQKERIYRVVGKGKEFPTLDAMIEFYKSNNIPGKTEEPVFLTFPIMNSHTGRFAPSPSPPDRLLENGRTTPKVKTFRPTAVPFSSRVPASPPGDSEELLNDEAMREASENDLGGGACAASDITSRPPMPIPRDSDHAASRHHLYSEPEHPDLDRIKMVLELCRHTDMMQASRKKCTCGLYLEESTLARGWMMHIDNEPGATQGHIFFLDTKTNTTAWSLPDDIAEEVRNEFPVKWEFVRKQMEAARRKNSGT